MRIRRGGPGDADAVIALFDEAVAWMVARGQTGQWGSEPMSRTSGWSRVCANGRRATGCGWPRPVGLLRVDCWAGAQKLVAFYEAQGFERDGTFDVRGWPGQVFSMRLGHQPGTSAR